MLDELTLAVRTQTEQAAVLLREAGYFRYNQRRMNYLELRWEEWPIGSGMVESGGKQFKARLCGPGMRWSRQGAENLLPVRAAILSQRFDELWMRIYNVPRIKTHPWVNGQLICRAISSILLLWRSKWLSSTSTTTASREASTTRARSGCRLKRWRVRKFSPGSIRTPLG